MRILKTLFVLPLMAALATAATAQGNASAIAKLEARRTADPSNVSVLRSLGVNYYEAKRYADGQRVLTEARRLSPKDGVVALYLGMCAENQGDLVLARDAYTGYIAVGKTKSALAAVKEKLAALNQRELAERSKAAVAQEQRLSSTASPTTTIAVLPLHYTGADQTLKPLERGIADLMITDLRRSRNLTILERDQVQAMLDEIARGQTTRVDAATAVRSGRLLQAGRVITGNIDATGANLTISAQIVTVSSTQIASPAASTGTINALFDLEKRTVLAVIQGLGYTLTAAEQNAIQERPTQNVQAFLAYSRGLISSDAGRMDEAAGFFDNAHALDPHFAAAAAHASEAHAALAGAGVTTGVIEARLKGSAEGQVVAAAERGATNNTNTTNSSLTATLANAIADVNPSTADVTGRQTTLASSRDASTSTTGQDQTTTRIGTLTIVIKRP